MSDNTPIEWADATVNAVNGCSVLSPGCKHCYAMRLAGTRLKHHPSRAGLTVDTKAGPVWTSEVRLNEAALLEPLKWKRPRRIFWNAHGDLFHEAVPDEWIDRVFAVCALTPQHTHMILTKRPERMREYMTYHTAARRIARTILDMLIAKQIKFNELAWPVVTEGDIDAPSDIVILWPLQNVWLGTSVEDQQRADERIPHLLATPAVVRFVSMEPLLEPVDLRWIAEPDDEKDGVIDALLGCNWVQIEGDDFAPARPSHQDRRMGRWVVSSDTDILANRKLDWVIVGGESGPGARPMHPAWARSLRDQCAAAGVPFCFKQWGEHIAHPAPGARWKDGTPVPADLQPVTFERVGKKAAGRLLDGIEHNAFPEPR